MITIRLRGVAFKFQPAAESVHRFPDSDSGSESELMISSVTAAAQLSTIRSPRRSVQLEHGKRRRHGVIETYCVTVRTAFGGSWDLNGTVYMYKW